MEILEQRIDPAHPVVAEKALIGCCFLEPRILLEQLALGRKAEIFSDPFCATVWRVLQRMRELDLEIGEVVALHTAAEMGFAEVVTVSKLSELTGYVESTAHVGSFLAAVMAGWRLRSFKTAAVKLGELAAESTSFEASREDAEALITRMSNLSLDEREVSLRQDTEKVIEDLREELAGNVRFSNELYSGMALFDRKFCPIDAEKYEDYMVVVAAGPSVGKSSFTRQLAWHNVQRGKRGCIFLLETTRKVYLRTMAAQDAMVNLRDLEEYNQLHGQRVTRMAEVLRELRDEYVDKSLFVYDSHFTIEEIESRARHVAARTGGLDFIVIDYVQLCGSAKKHGNREQEVAEVSRRIKILGKDLRCTVFAVAQISREGRKSGRAPVLEDLRESGAIEQDADRAIFLHRPESYKGLRDGKRVDIEQKMDQRILHYDIIQAKMRNGPVGTCSVLFERPYTQFRDYPNVDSEGNIRKKKKDGTY